MNTKPFSKSQTITTLKEVSRYSRQSPVQIFSYIRYSDRSQSKNLYQQDALVSLQSKVKKKISASSVITRKPLVDTITAHTLPTSRLQFKKLVKRIKPYPGITIILCSHPDRLLKTYSLKTIKQWVRFLKNSNVKILCPHLVSIKKEMAGVIRSTGSVQKTAIVQLVSNRLNETFALKNGVEGGQHTLDNSLVERCMKSFKGLEGETTDPDILFWSCTSFLGACLNDYLNLNKKKNDKSFGSLAEQVRRIEAIFNRLQKSPLTNKEMSIYLANDQKIANKDGKPFSPDTIKDNKKTPAYLEWELFNSFKVRMVAVLNKIPHYNWFSLKPVVNKKLALLLKEFFGFMWFRGKQYPAWKKLVKGNVVYSEKTGIGKSLLYHLHSLRFPDQLVVVVDPTLALIDNHLFKAEAFDFLPVGSVAKLIGTVKEKERKGVLEQITKQVIRILYVTPNQLLKPDLIKALRHRGVGLLVLDEIQHIVYSSNYRKEYNAGFLAGIRKDLGLPKTLCMSATIDQRVHREIRKKIFLGEDYNIVKGDLDRPNLFYYCKEFETTGAKNVFLENQLRLLRDEGLSKGVIYVATIRDAKRLVSYLQKRRFKNVSVYHSEMEPADKRDNLDAFIKCTSGIMVATTSFGEGLDYDFIRFVICYHVPSNMCEMVQLFGRAGRSGAPSFCGVLVDGAGIEIRRGLLNGSADLKKFLLSEFEDLLDTLRGDCCLRNSMLSFFGENTSKHTSPCCSVCDPLL